MSETSPLYRRAFDRLKDAKVGISTTLGMVAINLMCGDSNLSVYSDESLKKQLEMAVPSAFATPDTTGVKALDFGSVAVLMGASVEAARRTTSYTGIAATALSAQIISCDADAFIDQAGWFAHTQDNGPSSAFLALLIKTGLDHAASAETDEKRHRWQAATAVLAGAMTLGAWAFLGGDDGKMDMIAHTSAITVGAISYRLGSWRKQHRNTVPSVADSEFALETTQPAI